jgi:hypothetical protein
MGNALISAWVRYASRDDSVERAVGALKKLKQYAEADLVSYNTVLDAMSKKGLGRQAMSLLNWLETVSAQSNQGHLKPDLVSNN